MGEVSPTSLPICLPVSCHSVRLKLIAVVIGNANLNATARVAQFRYIPTDIDVYIYMSLHISTYLRART